MIELAALKSQLLNKPGRVTLADSVLAVVPSYNMQICRYPQYVCDRVDGTIRKFIWKGNGDKGMHLVSWSKITRNKKFGGPGVRRCKEQNSAMLGKLV